MTDQNNVAAAATEGAVDPIFDEKNQVKATYNTIKFGKIGDWFKGTLVDNTGRMKNQYNANDEQTILEFKSHGGSLHLINDKVVDENATIIVKGDFWSYITSNKAILNKLKNEPLGTIVGLRFKETIKAKNPIHNDAKIIDVYVGGIDPDYQGETRND